MVEVWRLYSHNDEYIEYELLYRFRYKRRYIY